MPNRMPIITALKSCLIKPEDFVAYSPDEERSKYIHSVFCDYEEKVTEFDLGWHACLYKDSGVLLVADKATNATITAAAEYGISYETLDDYVNLYRNESLNSVGVVLTTDILKEIPKCLSENFGDIWIFSTIQSGAHFRRSRNVHHYIDIKRPIQPMAFIPPDTIVEVEENDTVGKSKENRFKLYPRKSAGKDNLSNQSLESDGDSTKWIPIIDALRTRSIFTTDFVEYVPDKASVSFSPEETNTQNVQTANTEYNMGGWHPIVIRKGSKFKPYLVATHCTKFKLTISLTEGRGDEYSMKNMNRELFENYPIIVEGLCVKTIGKNQFEIGVELLKRYAQIYNNKELNLQAVPFNEEIFNAVDNKLRFKKDTYFIADPFVYNFYPDGDDEKSHMLYILQRRHERWMGLKWVVGKLYDEYGVESEEPMDTSSIRIAIPLPENTMVQINNPEYDGSTMKKALKILIPSEEKSE